MFRPNIFGKCQCVFHDKKIFLRKHHSRLESGDIVAVPRASSDDSGVSELYLGEVVSAVETLSTVSCDDGKTVVHQLTDHEIARYLKVNDLNTGVILKTCGPHIVNRQFFYRSAVGSLDSEQLPDGGAQQSPVWGHPWTTMLPNTNWSLSLAIMPTRNSTNSNSAQNHRNLPLPPLPHSSWI